jgi:hypothetical protein
MGKPEKTFPLGHVALSRRGAGNPVDLIIAIACEKSHMGIFRALAMEAGLLRRPAPEGVALLKLAALAGSPIERRRISRSIGAA